MEGVRREKTAKLKLFQDHQHHNSNNHQQSTEIQLSEDLQQQYSYNQPSQDHLQQITTFLLFQDHSFTKSNTMAQINSNWTAPTFSFDAADQPNAWIDFNYRAQDYLEVLGIKPEEEDQEKRGWEQITTMFTGENRQILQTLIDNNKITETAQ